MIASADNFRITLIQNSESILVSVTAGVEAPIPDLQDLVPMK
jgi:hypothetical protein